MKQGNSLTEVTDEKIKEFFEVHADIYDHDKYKQGLFLLGCFMNQILKNQSGQKITVLDKITFDGIATRKLTSLLNEVTEKSKVVKNKKTDNYVFNENSLLYAQIFDRLQSVEKSTLTPQEVVYYIMTGVAYSRYIGIVEWQKNKKKKLKEEKEND